LDVHCSIRSASDEMAWAPVCFGVGRLFTGELVGAFFGVALAALLFVAWVSAASAPRISMIFPLRKYVVGMETVLDIFVASY
jgi:hypothetical protein